MPTTEDMREDQRLAALHAYDVLDTPPEEPFDRITSLVRRVFGVSMSTITFIDGHRQWFKSRQGVDKRETSRGPALCNYAIGQIEPLVISDTHADAEFRDNPLVVGDPGIRFYAGVQLRSADGHDIGTLCAMDHKPRSMSPEQLSILSDFGRIVMDELELRLLATTDGLTGALSRRAFREEAGRVLALAARYEHEVSCIFFDLDHFKSVNDIHGHKVGDEVLKSSIEACRAALRQSDLIGRLGGEEFGVLLPHTGAVAAKCVAEKLRSAICSQSFAGAEANFAISASFGISTFGRLSNNLDVLLEHADEALYVAKSAGRNQCQVWKGNQDQEPIGGRRVLKAGKIVFNAGQSVIDCTVRRMSDLSASIDILNSDGIPSGFKLRIEADNFSRYCKVTQKAEKRLEVSFEA